MARIAIFEDNMLLKNIYPQIQGHDVVSCADTIEKAILDLGSMATHEIEADVVLLDGTLVHENMYDPPVFRYDLPSEFDIETRKTFFRKRPVMEQQRIEIVAKYDYPAGDGKSIFEIIDVLSCLGIIEKPTIIGISNDPMISAGIKVDHDLHAGIYSDGLAKLLKDIP